MVKITQKWKTCTITQPRQGSLKVQPQRSLESLYDEIKTITITQPIRVSCRCFYNFLCTVPAGYLKVFNNVYSNIYYLVFGVLFLVLTAYSLICPQALSIQTSMQVVTTPLIVMLILP